MLWKEFSGDTADHEIGHTLVAASVPDGSPGYISCKPGRDEEGEYGGICGASATSALSNAMLWIGGAAGEKVFGGRDRQLPEDSGDYRNWQSKSQEAGITPEESFNGACAILDTERNHAAHRELKQALEANGGELTVEQVREIINRVYNQFPEPMPLVGADAGASIPRPERKPGIADRINNWLYENPGQLFRDGKWRFWFAAQAGLQVLIGIATCFLFPIDTAILVFISSAILLWLIVGFLHYTDTQDPKLDKNVSRLDSASLIFAACHFSYLLWVFGHYSIIKHNEVEYETKRKDWNQEVDRDRDRNLKQTELEVQREKTREKIARYEADIAYRASLSGQRIRMRPTAKPENGGEEKLESKEKPKPLTGQGSQEYLAEKDEKIRFWHLGEILMAMITLIYVRSRSVDANHAHRAQPANPWREPKN